MHGQGFRATGLGSPSSRVSLSGVSNLIKRWLLVIYGALMHECNIGPHFVVKTYFNTLFLSVPVFQNFFYRVWFEASARVTICSYNFWVVTQRRFFFGSWPTSVKNRRKATLGTNPKVVSSFLLSCLPIKILHAVSSAVWTLCVSSLDQPSLYSAKNMSQSHLLCNFLQIPYLSRF